jgi:hypothetical protein
LSGLYSKIFIHSSPIAARSIRGLQAISFWSLDLGRASRDDLVGTQSP